MTVSYNSRSETFVNINPIHYSNTSVHREEKKLLNEKKCMSCIEAALTENLRFISSFTTHFNVCSCADMFESKRIGNLKGRFSCDEALM